MSHSSSFPLHLTLLLLSIILLTLSYLTTPSFIVVGVAGEGSGTLSVGYGGLPSSKYLVTDSAGNVYGSTSSSLLFQLTTAHVVNYLYLPPPATYSSMSTWGLAISPYNSKLYVTLSSQNPSISTATTSPFALSTVITISPVLPSVTMGICFHPTNTYLYAVGNNPNPVIQIDVNTGATSTFGTVQGTGGYYNPSL
jgi:hypothetical protein